MLKRYWVIAVVFRLIALSEVGYGQETQTHDSQNTEQPTETAPNNQPPPIRVEIVESDGQTDASEAAEQRAEQRELDDLTAQQGMNQATQNMALYALIQTILIAVGTGALIWTLHETRKATNAAVTAADAAIKTADITKEIGEAQVRAYVHLKNASFKRSRTQITITLNLENTGQSPARSVRVKGSAVFNLIGGLNKFPRVLEWVGSKPEEWLGEPISANGTGLCEISFFYEHSIEHWDSDWMAKFVTSGANEAHFDLTIQWVDVFGTQHELSVESFAHLGPAPGNRLKKPRMSGTLEAHRGDDRPTQQAEE